MSWDSKDTQKHTGDDLKKIKQAEHDARDAAAASGQLPERNDNKVSDSEAGKELHEILKKTGMTGSSRYSGG